MRSDLVTANYTLSSTWHSPVLTQLPQPHPVPPDAHSIVNTDSGRFSMLPFISSINSTSILHFTTNQPLRSRTLTIKFTFRFLFSVGKSELKLGAAWRRQDGDFPLLSAGTGRLAVEGNRAVHRQGPGVQGWAGLPSSSH